MEITEVRIKLMEDSDDRLQAFCSITFDNAFVVRDLKIIDGANGPFVAMPSRKLTAHCPACRAKNHLRAAYCSHCGKRLHEERLPRDADGRIKLYADVAHPINPQCRELIQARVIAEFKAELDRADEPGYVSRYDDDYDLEFVSEGGDDSPETGHEGPSSIAPPARKRSTRPSPPAETGPPRERTLAAQPPEIEPRPPHRPPTSQPAVPPPARPGRSQFGAGIFD